ncbi:MAG: TetR/AcrR family transcriptional regulator [Streptosporangiales bacterium]|jgi:AcrR family transcriptional regulator|nr:TetR/AcrR family transcriptional regulator [Streptosporangiales bacterium]
MPQGDTKARMVDSATRILRERGVSGVTVDAVLADSGAPRGSVYHHFPGGRDELVLTAGRAAADYITGLLTDTVAGCDMMTALDLFIAFWKQTLAETDYGAGCPVAALGAASASDAAMLLDLAAATFDRWKEALSGAIESTGFPPGEARILATTLISTLEGAITLCRVYRSSRPLDDVAGPMKSLLARR